MLKSWINFISKYKLEILLSLSLLFTREVNLTRLLGGEIINNYIDVVISPAIIILAMWLCSKCKTISRYVWILLIFNFCISWPLDWARGYSWLHTAIILLSWLYLVTPKTWQKIWWTLPLIAFFDHALLSSAYPVLIVIEFQKLYEVKRFLFVKTILLIQGMLGLLQIIRGSSVGLHVIGEKYLDLETAGVAKTVLGGTEILRAYGTFAHPIVFGFLFLAAINFLPNNKLLTVVGVLLSQSRAVIGSLLFKIKNKKIVLALIVFLISLMSIRVFSSDIYRYQDLVNFWQYLQDNPWRAVIGTGLGQYPFALQEYDLYNFQYQPVHSAPLLIFGEIGFLICYRFLRNVIKNDVKDLGL